MSGLLDGIRILDLSRLLPGGFGTALLADLGAEVVKIEQPGIGDYMRWMEPTIGDESAASWVVDRGKRSLAVDLKRPQGVEVVRRLARTADAVVESFRPGVVDRLGVGYEALRAENPRLVYCSISGYGRTGRCGPPRGTTSTTSAGRGSSPSPVRETACRRSPGCRSATSAAARCSRSRGCSRLSCAPGAPARESTSTSR